MAKRASIYLTDGSMSVLGDNLDSLSGRINSVITRYGEICHRDCPTMAEAEWSAICDTLNGTWINADDTQSDPARFLWAEISDADRLYGLGEKWGIDAQALASRIQSMDYSQQCAIIEVVTRFWKSENLNKIPMADLLINSGAKLDY